MRSVLIPWYSGNRFCHDPVILVVRTSSLNPLVFGEPVLSANYDCLRAGYGLNPLVFGEPVLSANYDCLRAGYGLNPLVFGEPVLSMGLRINGVKVQVLIPWYSGNRFCRKILGEPVPDLVLIPWYSGNRFCPCQPGDRGSGRVLIPWYSGNRFCRVLKKFVRPWSLNPLVFGEPVLSPCFKIFNAVKHLQDPSARKTSHGKSSLCTPREKA